jgi:hypothetical protein
MNNRSFLAIVGVVVGVLALAAPAQAARYDLSLGNYFSTSCTGTCPQERFQSMMTELGLVTAPVFLAPAETLGLNGFEFAFEGSVVPINNGEAYWTEAAEGNPGSVLFIPRVHVRKGLPFSCEVGTQLSYVPESELFVAGAEFKWALNEGFYFIPDLAVRFALNHMIGAKDFELTMGGWDVSLSKAFGIGGMLALTPYAGYNMLFIHASSHVVLAPDGSGSFTGKVFTEVNWQDNMHHRFFVGLRMTTFIFQVTLEGMFGSDINAFSFKLGFDY